MTSRYLPVEPPAMQAWLDAHPDWSAAANTVSRTFPFGTYAEALAFVVKVGLLAEKSNHHPDIEFGWGRVRVSFTTHDTGGLSHMDLDMAERTDQLVASP